MYFNTIGRCEYKCQNIVITKPSRRSERNISDDNFSAFDFFNLVGRTGRLNQHYIGDAYYLKAPSDPPYKKLMPLEP